MHACHVQHDITRLASRCDASCADEMGGPADTVVMEIFDSELIGEGVLPTMRDVFQSGVLKACESNAVTLL